MSESPLKIFHVCYTPEEAQRKLELLQQQGYCGRVQNVKKFKWQRLETWDVVAKPMAKDLEMHLPKPKRIYHGPRTKVRLGELLDSLCEATESLETHESIKKVI